MSDIGDNIERLSPQKLLESFSKGKAISCVILALAIHVVVIGGLSVRYIYYNWINPEAGELLRQREEQEAAEKKLQASAPAPATSNATGVAAVTPPDKTPQAAGEDRKIVQEHGDKPVVKAITDAAKPEEIPDMPTPGGLGISLDDTN